METEYSSYVRLPLHSHPFSYFCFVLGGSFTERFGRQERVCWPATLIFHALEEPHADLFHENGSRCFNIRPGYQLADRFKDWSSLRSHSAFFIKARTSELAARLYGEFLHPDDLSGLAIEGLTLELMAETARESSKIQKALPRWLRRVEDLLYARFSESLTLNEIAGSVGKHPVHVAREFRKHYRCTIGEYVRRIRIEYSLRHLSRSDRPLIEIALEAGFASQSHFSRTFKLITGETPSRYREIFR